MNDARSFSSAAQLDAWLCAHHAEQRELWVRIFKKGSGTPSVTWQDCVVACIAWGWIDGVKRSLDEASFLQRLTPRRPKSSWSKKNRAHAERLLAAGKMQPAGLLHVESARADGRWDQAYAGSADMELPAEFLRALEQLPEAKAFFATLKRQEVHRIYLSLQMAVRPETRAKRMATVLEQLAEGRSNR